jgi:SAM-dependent methyltransferase
VAGQWNHNVHYHPVVLAEIPSCCDSALDVGCGTGLLTRKLSAVVPHVTGVDRDEQSITIARSLAGPASGIEYVQGDFRQLPLQPGSFGLVTAVASLHHMDAAAALTRMRDLLRPGGVLVVIGLARDGWSPRDLAVEIPALVINRVQLFRHRASRHGPGDTGYKPPVVWPPADTYQQIRALATRLLPGMRYRRHLYWRYSICWHKPT